MSFSEQTLRCAAARVTKIEGMGLEASASRALMRQGVGEGCGGVG